MSRLISGRTLAIPLVAVTASKNYAQPSPTNAGIGYRNTQGRYRIFEPAFSLEQIKTRRGDLGCNLSSTELCQCIRKRRFFSAPKVYGEKNVRSKL